MLYIFPNKAIHRYLYIHIYIYIYIDIYIHDMYFQMNRYIYIYTFTYIYVYIYIYIHTYIFDVCIYIYIYTCIYIYLYVYIYIFAIISTYIETYIGRSVKWCCLKTGHRAPLLVGHCSLFVKFTDPGWNPVGFHQASAV